MSDINTKSSHRVREISPAAEEECSVSLYHLYTLN